MSLRGSCISLVLVCSLVITWCEPVTAQSKRSKRKTPSKPVLTELVVSTPEPSKVGQANVSYRADSNQTQVGVSLMVLSRPEMDLADLWVGFLVSGKEITKPGVVEFRLKMDGAAKGIFKGRAALEFRAGGKVFKLDNVKRKRDSYAGMPQGLMSGNISFAQFEQIAGTNQIEVCAGSLRFLLREIDHEGIRDLLKAAAGASFDK